jgi:hypothetical protein
VTAVDNGDSGNGSDMNVSFTVPSGQNTKISSYRIMVVKSANAGTFDLAAANAVTADNYTAVSKSGLTSGGTSTTTLSDRERRRGAALRTVWHIKSLYYNL